MKLWGLFLILFIASGEIPAQVFLPEPSTARYSFDKPPVGPGGTYVFFREGTSTIPWTAEKAEIPDLIANQQVFIRFNFPDSFRISAPVLYLESRLLRFEVYQGNKRLAVLPDSALIPPGDPGFYLIPMDSSLLGQPVILAIRFSGFLEFGNLDELKAGTREDLLFEAFEKVRAEFWDRFFGLSIGILLLVTGFLTLFIYLWYDKSRRSPLVPFMMICFVSAVDYLVMTSEPFISLSPVLYSAYLIFGLSLNVVLPYLTTVFFERNYGPGWKNSIRILKIIHLLLILVFILAFFFPRYMVTVILIPLVLSFVDFIFFFQTFYLKKDRTWKTSVVFGGFFVTFLMVLFDFIRSILIDPSQSFTFFGLGFITLAVVLAWEQFDLYRQTHTTVEKVTLELEHQKQELLALKNEQVQSQLHALKSQISPHFLFNSFSTLLGLIEESAEKATRFVEYLAQVYRYVLVSGSQDLATLGEEMEFVQAYRYLLEQRHQDGLFFRFELADQDLQALIPVLTLQLLIENATKHNTLSAKKPLHILIKTTGDGYLEVRNNLQRKSSFGVSTGIGLPNIRERYRFYTPLPVEILETETGFTVRVPLIVKGQPA